MLVFGMWITPFAQADDAQSDADDATSGGITVTEYITDTGNLLGSHVAEVTDAINDLKADTGVTVRLIYLSSFNSEEKPAQWASDVLESDNPDPNTVLLAVASNDGNLVVAVSSNSDEWLRRQTAVDSLSDAAQQPLMESTPNWSQSAIAMIDEISKLHTKSSGPSVPVTIAIMGAVAAALVVVAIVVVIFKRRRASRVAEESVETVETVEKTSDETEDDADTSDAIDGQDSDDAGESDPAGGDESVVTPDDDSRFRPETIWSDSDADELQDDVQETSSQEDHS